MTREQIEELEQLLDSGDWMPDSSDTGDLLRIAKRALLLEERVDDLTTAIREALFIMEGLGRETLQAAIDRAEGK